MCDLVWIHCSAGRDQYSTKCENLRCLPHPPQNRMFAVSMALASAIRKSQKGVELEGKHSFPSLKPQRNIHTLALFCPDKPYSDNFQTFYFLILSILLLHQGGKKEPRPVPLQKMSL